jgi:hypothetical protein
MSPFDDAWLLLKAGLVRPIGTHAGRRVVTVGGVPYYQSKGQSHTPGLGKKEAGAWFPFAGIETRAGVYQTPTFSNPENWWMKGNIFNTNPYNRPEHEMDWKSLEPTIAAHRLAMLEPHFRPERFPQMTPDELNAALRNEGFDVPVR